MTRKQIRTSKTTRIAKFNVTQPLIDELVDGKVAKIRIIDIQLMGAFEVELTRQGIKKLDELEVDDYVKIVQLGDFDSYEILSSVKLLEFVCGKMSIEYKIRRIYGVGMYSSIENRLKEEEIN